MWVQFFGLPMRRALLEIAHSKGPPGALARA